jgi:hypothetical protein
VITLTSGGVVYKHKLEAVAGDLWISTNPPYTSLVGIVRVCGNYIEVEPMTPDSPMLQLYATQFYTQFMKVTKYTRKCYNDKKVTDGKRDS